MSRATYVAIGRIYAILSIADFNIGLIRRVMIVSDSTKRATGIGKSYTAI